MHISQKKSQLFILAESKKIDCIIIAILDKTGWSAYLNTETLFHTTLSILINTFTIQKALIPKSKLFRTTLIVQVSLSVRRWSRCESPWLFLSDKRYPKHIYALLTKKIINGKLCKKSGFLHSSTTLNKQTLFRKTCRATRCAFWKSCSKIWNAS